MTKASVRPDGRVSWEPPAVYKSSCTMDVEFFPFDEQLCSLKFGSWTYDATQVEIIHTHQGIVLYPDLNQPVNNTAWSNNNFNYSSAFRNNLQENNTTSEYYIADGVVVVHKGIDLTDFYESFEWDLLAVPALKKIYNKKGNQCCHHAGDNRGEGGLEYAHVTTSVPQNCSKCCVDVETCLLEKGNFRPEITFNITIRRKTLFHTVNLILPCVAISLLTVIVFHLPSDSGEKVALSISILLSLTVFFLLLAEIIPPTSLVVPLIGKFLLFTMLLVTFSIFVTVIVLNVHFRSPSYYVSEMSPRTRYFFLHLLPRLLRVDTSKCLRKKKRFLPYKLQSCLQQSPSHVCFPPFDATIPLDSRANQTNLVDYQVLSRSRTSKILRDQNENPSEENEPRHFGATVISHQSNFVRGSGFQCVEGGVLCREDTRQMLKEKLEQLQQERASETTEKRLNYNHHHHQQQQQQLRLHEQEQHRHSDDQPTSRATFPSDEQTPSNFTSQPTFPRHQSIQTPEPPPWFRLLNEDKPLHRCSPVPHPEILKVFQSVQSIADHLMKENEIKNILEDWKFVAMVLDRLFFWLFTAACVCGGVIILLQAPSIYDSRVPLTRDNP